MKTIVSIFLIVFSTVVFAGNIFVSPKAATTTRSEVTAFLVNTLQTGNTKQCVYKYLDNTYIITIPFTKNCELTTKLKIN